MLPGTDDQTARDHAQYAGDMQQLARGIGAPRPQQTAYDVQLCHRHTAQYGDQRVTDDQSGHHAAGGDQDELPRGGSELDASRRRSRYGDPEQHQAGRIVDQAFTLQQRNETPGHGQAFQHGLRRDRVGRRHDGAEGEAGRPGEAWQHEMRDDADDQGRERDGADGKLEDDAGLARKSRHAVK